MVRFPTINNDFEEAMLNQDVINRTELVPDIKKETKTLTNDLFNQIIIHI